MSDDPAEQAGNSGAPSEKSNSQRSSTSSEGDDGTNQSNYKVLYTPKRLLSDEETAENLEQFINKRIERRRSRPHALFATEGKANVISSHSRTSLPQLRVSVDLGTSKSIVEQLQVIQNTAAAEADKIQLTSCLANRRRSMYAKNVHWPGYDDEDNSSRCIHFPPDVRQQTVRRVLEIRDLLIEVVVLLQSTGFGGADFKWNKESLERHSITLPQKIKIPEAFKSFAKL